jgi:hypothetical protein
VSEKKGEAPAPIGCAWVSLALMLFGVPVFIPLVRDAIEEIRIRNSYRETECRIVRTELQSSESSVARQGRQERGVEYRLRIQSRHQLDGREVTAFGFASGNFQDDMSEERARAFVAQFPGGKTVPCWYDPSKPERVVLHNEWGDRRRYLLLIPTGFAIVFGATMAWVVLADRRKHGRFPLP